MTYIHPSPIPRQSRPRKVSPRKRREQREINRVAQARRQLIGDHCEFRVPGVCIDHPTCAGHLLNQSQGGNASPKGIKLACVPCNGWAEDHPDEARAMGIKLFSWESPAEIGGTKPIEVSGLPSLPGRTEQTPAGAEGSAPVFYEGGTNV